MTDEEAIDEICTLFEIRSGGWVTIRRNGHILLALPPERRGALRALKLYQPQRLKARVTMAALGLVAGLGLHGWILPRVRHQGGIVELEPDSPRAIPYTTGILLGSPEHRVRRAIASFKTKKGWEVAKIAFGEEGWDVIHGEATALKSLPESTPGAPALLGIHRGHSCSLIRMPYVQGRVIQYGESMDAIALLNLWVSDLPPKDVTDFPEWPSIEAALSGHPKGSEVLDRLASIRLTPVIRHGDFARWNLLRTSDGKLIALDWEWGHPNGMPGLDLVHYFLQDARLVRRLSPADAIADTLENLGRPDCSAYLAKTGWSGDPLLPIIASLAYKQGAEHQENREMVGEILNFEF